VTTLAPPPPAAPAAPRRRTRWWLVGISVAWALVLMVAAYFSHRDGEPTVREQRSIDQAWPVVDRAAGEIVAAAGPGVVPVLSSPDLRDGCRITSARDGAELRQEITIHAPAGQESALLSRLQERLPAAYRTGLRMGPDGRPDALRADAGEFVGVRGGIVSPGLVRLTVSTGCRPSRVDALLDVSQRPVDEVPTRLLAALPGAAPPDIQTGGSIPCPGGGAAETITDEARVDPAPTRLSTALPAAEGATVLVDEPARYVYVDGPGASIGVVVETIGDRVRVSATVGCAQ
jgi:hypothetical protein